MLTKISFVIMNPTLSKLARVGVLAEAEMFHLHSIFLLGQVIIGCHTY